MATPRIVIATLVNYKKNPENQGGLERELFGVAMNVRSKSARLIFAFVALLVVINLVWRINSHPSTVPGLPLEADEVSVEETTPCLEHQEYDTGLT